MSAGAAAQSRPDNSAWLPAWNKASGKLDAYRVLEPTRAMTPGNRMPFGSSMLAGACGLAASDSLGVLCNGRRNFSSGLGELPNNCLLATLGERLEEPDTKITAGAAF